MISRPPLFRTVLFLLSALLPLGSHAAVPLSADYVDGVYCANVASPTCVVAAPDGTGRLFVSSKEGAIVVIPSGGRQYTFAKIRPVYSESECGVLGLCFDPDFLRNRYVYVFVTVSAKEQRIIRYRDAGGIGVDKVTLRMSLPTNGANHDGGALGIGPDARLYWAVGDNGIGRGANADLRTLASKIGRANLDGTVPPENPFYDGAGPINDYIWATGFRNPFTMAFQPRTGQLWLDVVGSAPSMNGYEQIFTPQAGEDGGWNVYEGNQPSTFRYSYPFVRPFAHPVVQYKTDVGADRSQARAIASIVRSAGVVSVVLQKPHPYRVGEIVQIGEAGALSGDYIVGAVQGTGGFTAPSPGPDLAGTPNRGTVRLPSTEGCVDGGCFYESTAFPASARGSYFFPDLNSGNVWQLRLDADNKPAGISRLVSHGGGIVSMTVGRDGAIYYADHQANSIRRIGFRAPTEMIVTPTTFRILEGGDGLFTVHLPSAPESPLTVTVTPVVPDSGVTIVSGSTLTFTPENWRVPQAVRLVAPVNAGTVDLTSDFTITVPGYADETVRTFVTDTTTRSPAVSATELEVTAGETATFSISLPAAPARATVISTRRADTSRLAPVTEGAALTFTPDNWQTPQTVQITTRAFSGADRVATFNVFGYGYFRRVITLTMHGTP